MMYLENKGRHDMCLVLLWLALGALTSGIAFPGIASGQGAESGKSSDCEGVLEGRVVDSITDEAVPEAIVLIDRVALTKTNSEGRFVLSQVCPGETEIEIRRVDYKTLGRSLVFPETASMEFRLESRWTEVIEIVEENHEERDMLATATIGGEALERTRGRSFSDALAQIPGVRQLRSGSGQSKPIIRGQSGRRLLVLVDSIPHRSQEWGLDHAPEIDPFIAGELKVVRGASGVRYGPGAIGGAVLVVPPPLLKSPGFASEVHVLGFVDRGAGIAARIQAASEKFPGLAYQIEGSGKRLGAPSTPDYALQNTGSLEWSIGGTIGHHKPDVQYTLSARHYQSRLGVCACLQIESSEDFFAQLERERPVNSELFEPTFAVERPFQTVIHDQVIARAEWNLNSFGKLRSSYSLQFDHRKEFAQVRNATGPQFDFRLTSHDAEVLIEHKPTYIAPNWHLRGSIGAVGALQVHSYRGLPLVPDYLATGGGVFAIERLLGEELELELGIRFDYLTRRADLRRNDFLRLVRSEQLSSDSCDNAATDTVNCESSFRTLSGSVGALVQHSSEWSSKLELSTAARPPSPDEQYLNGTSPTFPVLGLGKPDLVPEVTYSSSLTESYRTKKLAFEASAYANLIADYIYFSPAIDGSGQPVFDVLIRGSFPRFVTRSVDALFYGADGGFKWQPSPSIELAGQASVVRGSNRSDGGFLVLVPSDSVRGSAKIWSAHKESERAWFAVSGTYTAKQDRFDAQADLAAPPGAYFLLDAELGGETKIDGQTLKFSMQGSNLLNTRYRDYTSLLRYFADQPGLQVMFRLSVFLGSSRGNL